MQQEQHNADDFNSKERRKRTMRIVIAHLLIVATFFFLAFMYAGNAA